MTIVEQIKSFTREVRKDFILRSKNNRYPIIRPKLEQLADSIDILVDHLTSDQTYTGADALKKVANKLEIKHEPVGISRSHLI